MGSIDQVNFDKYYDPPDEIECCDYNCECCKEPTEKEIKEDAEFKRRLFAGWKK